MCEFAQTILVCSFVDSRIRQTLEMFGLFFMYRRRSREGFRADEEVRD